MIITCIIVFIIVLVLIPRYRLYRMYSLLDSVIHILHKNDIACYIDCGTLLGCVRDGGLMIYDSDVDVTIHTSDWDRLKLIDFSTVGLITDVKTNLLRAREKGINLHYYCDIYANPAFPHLSSKTIVNPFGEKKVYPIPINSELYLEMVYGVNWKTPNPFDKGGSWPTFFYNELITSEYASHWDRSYPIIK
jgi:hypothetical protein